MDSPFGLDSEVNFTSDTSQPDSPDSPDTPSSYTSPLDPRKHYHLLKSEPKIDRSAVDLGPSFKKNVSEEILILLGLSLCIIFVHFLRKHCKNIEILEEKKRAAERAPPSQVNILLILS